MRRITMGLALVLLVAACGGEDTVAEAGDFVEVHYVGTLDDGTEFDNSRTRGATLDFEIGNNSLIAGFDRGVRGMAQDEIKTVRIEPADGYGESDPNLLVEVDEAQVPEGVQAGDVLQDPGTGAPITVVSVSNGKVTLDLNPPLAGKTITFEIEMVAINP